MKRAELFANVFQSDSGSVVHIYDDGFILVCACSADRHLDLARTFREYYPNLEEGRSADGWQSVFVIPVDLAFSELPTLEDVFDEHWVVFGGPRDHRMENLHTLELVEKWFSREVQ